MAEDMTKTDCMFYKIERGQCIALRDTYCKEENCNFYKKRKEENKNED